MNPILSLAEYAEPLLNSPYILRTRRNHGLEHATIHILSRANYKLSGRSSDQGFIILGNVPSDRVENAVNEALQRMQSGERKLAVHPNCGTNLVTAGFAATAAAWLGFAGGGWRRGWERFPTMMVIMMAVLLFSKPLGMSLQRHITTEGDPGDLRLLSVKRETLRVPFTGQQLTIHRILTQQG
ncbi:MAG: DUF6391 domain-containing protein [Chloroflexota bacterium]|nr:DUF6391 domain-containing protein [Chloroflexota bacterium]